MKKTKLLVALVVSTLVLEGFINTNVKSTLEARVIAPMCMKTAPAPISPNVIAPMV
ncbi:MAG TPA: hypothetical protein VIK86_05695 [Candidatus Paceibacterota bacterium]